MKVRLAIKIMAFALLLQGWMPYFVEGCGKQYVECFFKLLSVYLCLSYYEQTRVENKIERTVSMLFFGLCLSNLVDELFFNPCEFNLNEYAGAIVAILISAFEYLGWHTLLKLKMTNFMDKTGKLISSKAKFVRKD